MRFVVALRRRHVFAPVGLVLLATTTTSCSVPTAGWAAVGVDSDGDLIGIIQMCDHHVDGATLYRSDAPTDERGLKPRLGKWESADAVTDFARWSFASPSDDWTPLADYEAPAADGRYSLYGWTRDNSWSTVHASFNVADIAQLQPGEVLYGDGRVTTVGDFRAHVCDD